MEPASCGCLGVQRPHAWHDGCGPIEYRWKPPQPRRMVKLSTPESIYRRLLDHECCRLERSVVPGVGITVALKRTVSARVTRKGYASSFNIGDLLRPHWAALAGGIVAVVVEGITNLLEPWPKVLQRVEWDRLTACPTLSNKRF